MNIYLLDEQQVWTGEMRELEPKQGRPLRSVTVSPPELQAGEYARWAGGAWEVLDGYPAKPKEYRQFTPLSVLELFTEEEQLTIVTASMSVPAVRLWYDKLIAATFVSYADPRMDTGLQTLVGAGLITQERKDAIAEVMGVEVA